MTNGNNFPGEQMDAHPKERPGAQPQETREQTKLSTMNRGEKPFISEKLGEEKEKIGGFSGEKPPDQ